MTVNASYSAELTVDETITAVDAKAPTVTHQAFNTSYTLNGSTTPPASQYAGFAEALVAGAATVDMTNLVGTNAATVNGTGLQVRAFHFVNPKTNAAALVFTVGGSNPYLLAGAAWKFTLLPGDDVLMYLTGAPVIGSGAKNIAVTGTGTDVVQCGFLLG